MLRHAIFAAAVLAAGLSMGVIGAAQDRSDRGARSESLAERIERMRSVGHQAPASAQPSPVQQSDVVAVEWTGERQPLRTVVTRPIEQLPSSAAPAAVTPGPLRMAQLERPTPRHSSRRGAEPTHTRSPAVRESRVPETATSILQDKLSDLADAVLGPSPQAAARQAPQRLRPPLGRADTEISSRRRQSTAGRPTPAPTAVAPRVARAPRSAPTQQVAPLVIENTTDATPDVTPESEPQPAQESPVLSSSRRTAGQPNLSREAVAERSPIRVSQTAPNENILLTVQGPQLQARTLGPRRLTVGRPAEFTVMISNDGDAAADEVLVAVQLPVWVDVESTTPTRGAAQLAAQDQTQQIVNWQIPRLAAGDSETVALNLIPRGSKPVELAIRYTYAQTGSSVQVEVEEPLLNMVISGPSETVFGQTKVFVLTVSNPGTGDAENVTIKLLPLDGSTRATDSHTLGTLRRGETKTLPVELTAAQAGAIFVRAEAMADGGLRAEANKEVLVRRAVLNLAADGPQAVYAGHQANYTLRVHNGGNAHAENVTVEAALPAGAEFISASGPGEWSAAEQQVRWDLGGLAAGDAVEMQIQCRLASDGLGQLRVAAADASDLRSEALVETTVVGRADLKLSVSDPTGPAPIGDEALYEVKIVNRGTKAAETVEIVVFFSEGIEPLRVEGGEYELAQGQVVLQPIESLAPGAERVYQVFAKAAASGDHVFRAEVACRALGARLVAQETTHYYGADFTRTANRAAQPQPAPLEPTPIKPLERY